VFGVVGMLKNFKAYLLNREEKMFLVGTWITTCSYPGLLIDITSKHYNLVRQAF
jgi:hypothetical protein